MRLKAYRVTYRDDSEGSPDFSYTVHALNVEHARDRFYDGPDADGWLLVSIDRCPQKDRT